MSPQWIKPGLMSSWMIIGKIMRPNGEVPFSNNVWLKRYHDQKNWMDIRESQAIRDIKQYYPNNWKRMIHNAKIGKMSITTKYFDLMWSEDSVYQDELPYNERYKDYIYNQ